MMHRMLLWTCCKRPWHVVRSEHWKMDSDVSYTAKCTLVGVAIALTVDLKDSEKDMIRVV